MFKAQGGGALYAMRMRARYTSRMIVGLSLLAAVGPAASGCAATPGLAPEPSSPIPVFSSDEEALEVAEATIRAYVTIGDQILASGGANVDELRAITTPELFELENDEYSDFSARMVRRTGQARVGPVYLQQRYEVDGYAHILIYYCLDYSGTRLFDSAQADITPTYLSTPASFEAELRSQSPGSNVMLVASSQLDDGGTVCQQD